MNLLLHSKYLIEVSVVEASLKKYVIYKLVMFGTLQVLQLILHRNINWKTTDIQINTRLSNGQSDSLEMSQQSA